MAAFAVTGSTTSLGWHVVARLGGGDAVVELHPDRPVDLGGAGCLVSLAIGPGPTPEPAGASARLVALRQALAAADGAGVRRVIHLSSAVVYGAAADNDVSLPDDAPVRPDPSFPWAVELAEAERLVAEWRDGGPGRAAAVLRPALVVAPGDDGLLAHALGGLSGPRPAGETRPVQFVHVEDVASAVVLCATAPTPVDGTLNVAPEGWIGDDEAAALAGYLLPPPKVPARFLHPARRLVRLIGGAVAPPEAEAYADHPWVVAADRLRSLGWSPAHTVEEAVVATTSCSTLASLSPGRRREALLGVTTALLAAVVSTVVALVVRAVRAARR